MVITTSGLAQPIFGYDFKSLPLYKKPEHITQPNKGARQEFKTKVAMPAAIAILVDHQLSGVAE